MPRFLVVDDSATIRHALAAFLHRAVGPGTEVLQAGDTMTALELFARRPPDVVFLDLRMPGGPGGLTALRAMLARNPRARVVLVTMVPASDPDVREAFAVGAYDHLQKPAQASAVLRVLRRMIAERTGGAGGGMAVVR